MLCFDKLKITTSIDYIKDINMTVFKKKSIGDVTVETCEYKQTSPYSLLIRVDYLKNELVIEFTSKILLDNCIQLININNINECFNNINKLNICRLDINNIVNNSEVVKSDVTVDKPFYGAFQELKRHTISHISNHNKWICKSYQQGGLVVEKTVSTTRYKNRLCIYPKEKELKKCTKKVFLEHLSNKEQVLSYFKDKVRIELNINSKAQIRSLLGIEDTKLLNVLQASANPILTVIDEAIRKETTNTYCSTTIKERFCELMLIACGWDLRQLEAELRILYAKSTQITKIMKPYIALYNKRNNVASLENSSLRALVMQS